MIQRRSAMGFTMVELMTTLVIAAILLALAVPSFRLFVEKRQVEAAAQDLQNFIATAQSLAVKRNQIVAMSWWAEDEDHDADFCLGISSPPKDMPCDCQESVATEDDFCSVGATAADAGDGTPYRVLRTDLVESDHNFMHFRPATGSYQFDPVRGTMVVAPPNGEDNAPGRNFRIHSHLERPTEEYGTLFAVDVTVSLTGRVNICNDNGEPQTVGPWPSCGY